MLPGTDGYFAADVKTLGLNDDQVKALMANTDSQLLDFVSGVASVASHILSNLQPAGSC